MKRLLFALSAAALFSGSAAAQTLYVTDQFTLDIYEKPADDSPVAGSVPSGADVQVHGREEGFLQVRAADGTEGWVNADYLTERPPLRLQLEALSPVQREWLDEIAELQARLHTKERELAALRPPALGEIGAESEGEGEAAEMAGEVETGGDAAETAEEIETEGDAELAVEPSGPTSPERQALERDIGELRERIAELRQLVAAGDGAVAAGLAATIETLRAQNTGLRARIVSAHALLDGKGVPTGEELARVRPGIPRWFWGVLVAAMAAGALVGAALLDWRYRRRHGGFRI